MRRVRHRLHPARHDALLVARADRLRAEHHGFETRPAHLVDRERRYGPREASVDRRLAARCLPDTALEDVPHYHFLDRAGVDPGAAHGLADPLVEGLVALVEVRADARCAQPLV